MNINKEHDKKQDTFKWLMSSFRKFKFNFNTADQSWNVWNECLSWWKNFKMWEMKNKQVKNENNDNEKKDSIKNQSIVNVLKLHSYIKWESNKTLNVKKKKTEQHVKCFFALTLLKLFM